MSITDFGDMEEAREWREKIKKVETEAMQVEQPVQTPDFQ
jgi:hypothetical protein